MRRPQSLPIVRADVFKPFLVSARRIGVPIERHLRLARLPSAIIDEPNRLLPEIPCWQFLDSVARAEAMSTYGLIGGSTVKHFELDSLAPLLIGCSNLNELLQRFIAGAPLVSNSVRYGLEPTGTRAWFVKEGYRLLANDVQAQLFQVLGMIQLVQLAAGADWRPEEIRFTFPYHRDVDRSPELNPSRILFSQSRQGILVPRSLLALPVCLPSSDRSGVAPLPRTVAEQLIELLNPYVGDDPISKEMAADIVGLSPRTLQRRLVREQTNFAQIIDRIRLHKARTLLDEGAMKMIDISLALGYGDAPSFTRAFRRWTGVSPREYRQLALSGDIRG